MKKITALLLGIMMAFQLTACSSESSSTSQTEDIQSNTEQTSQKDSTTVSEANTEDTQATKPDSGTGKTLVVYYSATGNTEEAAQLIAEETGGDLFELEPVEPYSDSDLNWSDEDSRVTKEHENPDQRDVELVKTTVDGWDEYDTVFIGYPIWWGIAAWPVVEIGWKDIVSLPGFQEKMFKAGWKNWNDEERSGVVMSLRLHCIII